MYKKVCKKRRRCAPPFFRYSRKTLGGGGRLDASPARRGLSTLADEEFSGGGGGCNGLVNTLDVIYASMVTIILGRNCRCKNFDDFRELVFEMVEL